MMRTLIYYLILINLLLSSISLSEEVDIFSLDPIDVCVALERDDCDNASPESFMHQMTKFIDVKDKTCLFVSVSKDIKTNKLTTTSYNFWNKRDQWGDNQFCSKNKGMSLGGCNSGVIKGKEECIILFDGKYNKIKVPGFKSKLEKVRLSRLSGTSLDTEPISFDGNTSENIKTKLESLKKLLDEDLISQEQYNEMSSKILDDF